MQRNYDIGNEPLLDAEGEKKMSKHIEAGLRAKERLDEEADTLSKEETARLKARVRRGHVSKHRFIMANTRLIESILQKTSIPPTVGRDDLFQEAVLALDNAVEKFDWRKGFKFSTYGSLWINQAIRNSIRKQLGVVSGASLVQNQWETMQKIRNDPGLDGYFSDGARSDAEIAEIMQVSPERFKVIAAWNRGVLSFEQPVGNDDEASMLLGDTIADQRASEMFGDVEIGDRRNLILEMTEDLPEDEAVALQRTLDGDGPADGQSAKQHRNATERAMSRLRHPSSPHSSAAIGYIT